MNQKSEVRGAGGFKRLALGLVAVVLGFGVAIAFAADNTSITPGSGASVATDDVSNVHYQKFKLVDGTADSTTPAIVTGDGALRTAPTPAAAGGLSVTKLISAASTNATSVKASAGQVYGWSISNTNAAARFVKLYNKASAPTVGTDVPVMTILVPPNAQVVFDSAHGVSFGTGIALATTTGVGDADMGAVAASEIVVNLFWK
ncbi:hypothetical protein [Dongia deserti]|uniref:hypothetical protein n=1 Tax=Dongia deserti TaxID=2268030 RepID=UPI000E650927|nr:hypothetical protein [Dongia deserti]